MTPNLNLYEYFGVPVTVLYRNGETESGTFTRNDDVLDDYCPVMFMPFSDEENSTYSSDGRYFPFGDYEWDIVSVVRNLESETKSKELALKLLREIPTKPSECGHMDADEILLDFLISLGHQDVVDEYRRIEKWFA